MKKLLCGWLLPVGLFVSGIIYVTLVWLLKEDITIYSWMDHVTPAVYPSAFWLLIKGMLASGVVETSKTYKARKQREAEEFESMPDEVKQLHIDAQNKVAEFHFNLIVFIITSAASGYLIYLCVK